MFRDNYWKVWIVVILGLVFLRLLTLISSEPSQSPRLPPKAVAKSTPAQAGKVSGAVQNPNPKPKSISKANPAGAGSTSGHSRPGAIVIAETPSTPVSQSQQAPSATSAGEIHEEDLRAIPPSSNAPNNRPVSSSLPSRSYFTVGSTKDEVLAVQGTPTKFTEYQWDYGLSEVYFRDGRVVSWKVFPGSPLKAQMRQ